MKIMTEDLTFLELKQGKSSTGNWYLLKVEDSKGKHFNFFVNDPNVFKNCNVGDSVILELYVNLKKINNVYTYDFKVV